jgi:hypothetical protein
VSVNVNAAVIVILPVDGLHHDLPTTASITSTWGYVGVHVHAHGHDHGHDHVNVSVRQRQRQRQAT